jgi:hypothetical protein
MRRGARLFERDRKAPAGARGTSAQSWGTSELRNLGGTCFRSAVPEVDSETKRIDACCRAISAWSFKT